VLTPEEQKAMARKNWWSFRPVVRPALPAVRDPWVRTLVDAFVLAKLQAKGWRPSPELSKLQLIRRVTLDLTGLPPTPAEVQQYLADRSPDSYQNLVERLMASPAYGERWAVKWLDVVRYADTNGFELDAERTHSWRYRDYVINAFNSGKPYDRFLQEQLAGDEIWPGDPRALIATGFLRAGPEHLVGGNQDEEMNRQEVLVEMTAGVGAAFLGLTLNCARCHNHKFDPILQSDYYRLQAIFAGTKGADLQIASAVELQRAEAAQKEHAAKLDPIQKAIAAIEKPHRERLRAEKRKKLEPLLLAALSKPKDQRNDDEKRLAKDAEEQSNPSWDEVLAALGPVETAQRRALRQKLHALNLDAPDPAAHAYAVSNLEAAPKTHILKIGDHRNKLAEVRPGVPLVLANGFMVPESPAGRRRALGEWLTRPDHPLTARVMVNRIWQLRMGAGLVRTPNDYGALGERPTHPELLDWLAAEFMAKGWSVQAIDKLIVMSASYRQSAAMDAAKYAVDADNKLYWRASRRRLEGEFLRDSMLAVTGELNRQSGGRPVKTPIEQELYDLIFTEYEADNLWPLPKDRSEMFRRSIYLLNKRTVRLPLLANFDQPDAMTSCASRPVSVHSLQALNLLNSDFVNERAAAFAARLNREAANPQARIMLAYQLALGRAPSATEIAEGIQFLTQGGLPDFCLAMLNRNEFLYLP
jgi:hypothetical protein